MQETVSLYPQLTRVISHFKKYDIEVPHALLENPVQRPDLAHFPYPLPQKKSAYTCFSEGKNGVMWYGAKGGVTRYDPNTDRLSDKVMYFSAQRDILDNDVRALLSDGDGVWVLTATGASHIEMVPMSMEEKALRLLDETLTYVQRHGMVSQKHLSELGNLKSVLPYGHSDNDGCFSAGFAIGEIFHYAVLKKEKGETHKDTLYAREVATRASEACLLLMYISGRGDGFVARTYLTASEPVPDDGLFYQKEGETAVCVNTTAAQKRGLVGKRVKADAPIPERLRHCYTDEGFRDIDITYKGDTSSDEITLHFLHLLVAHEFLGRDDPELDTLLRDAAVATMSHIIDHGFELHEMDGKPTTWAKWSKAYFETYMGWADACLNAAEVLMYLRVTMRLTGETGKWQEAYELLKAEGYEELTLKHFDRFHQASLAGGLDDREEIMYGDHMLAVAAFWGLISLTPESETKELFRKGFSSWRYSLAPECNPGYDFLYFQSCPGFEEPDPERIRTWFYRFGVSRLVTSVSMTERLDVPKHFYRGGYTETSVLLPGDEFMISKYDRNPFDYRNQEGSSGHCVESCYPFTFAYWIGRYFGFIKEGK